MPVVIPVGYCTYTTVRTFEMQALTVCYRAFQSCHSFGRQNQNVRHLNMECTECTSFEYGMNRM